MASILGTLTLAAAMATAQPPPPSEEGPPPDGRVLLRVGPVLIGVGLIAAVVGALGLGGLIGKQNPDPASSHGEYNELGLIGVCTGALLAGSGIVVTAIGADQRNAYREWRSSSARFAPAIARSRHGTWTFGVQLHF